MTNTDSLIRTYKDEDLKDLLEAFRLNVPTYFDPKEESDFLNFMEHERQYFLVIEVNMKVVGCTGYMIDENKKEGKITWVFFNPNYQGKGLGQKLVGHCMTQIESSEKVNQIIVRTSQLADKFFSKFGFELVETKKDYWGKGLDLYFMKKAYIS